MLRVRSWPYQRDPAWPMWDPQQVHSKATVKKVFSQRRRCTCMAEGAQSLWEWTGAHAHTKLSRRRCGLGPTCPPRDSGRTTALTVMSRTEGRYGKGDTQNAAAAFHSVHHACSTYAFSRQVPSASSVQGSRNITVQTSALMQLFHTQQKEKQQLTNRQCKMISLWKPVCVHACTYLVLTAQKIY